MKKNSTNIHRESITTQYTVGTNHLMEYYKNKIKYHATT